VFYRLKFRKEDAMTSLPHDRALPREYSASLVRVSYAAYRILQTAFVALPLLFGIDKFFFKMTDWNQWVAPSLARGIGGNTNGFLVVLGIIEIIVACGVAVKPKYFAYVVSVWALAIVIDLLAFDNRYDICLLYLAIGAAAFALGQLAMHYDFGNFGGLMRHRRDSRGDLSREV
jgi:hypothetical protein